MLGCLVGRILLFLKQVGNFWSPIGIISRCAWPHVQFLTEILCSLVALHGLNGHREKTWTFEGKGKSKDVLWLRDLLPPIIPNARIWTWGYDSRTRSKSHGEQLTIKSLYDHGRELVFDLDGERRASNSHRRPIIFIVHSLGGIVLKSVSLRNPGVIDFALTQGNAIQALLHSDRVREGNLEEQRSIKISTYGIIFMGTPHQGGQGVGIGKIMLNIAKAQGHTSDNLLKQLEVHSELLQQQLSEFTLICQDFEMYFAYETKPTPIVGSVAMVVSLISHQCILHKILRQSDCTQMVSSRSWDSRYSRIWDQ